MSCAELRAWKRIVGSGERPDRCRERAAGSDFTVKGARLWRPNTKRRMER